MGDDGSGLGGGRAMGENGQIQDRILKADATRLANRLEYRVSKKEWSQG